MVFLHRPQALVQLRFRSVKGTIRQRPGSHPDAHQERVERSASRRGAKAILVGITTVVMVEFKYYSILQW
ncbi:MAG: hypothetical protein HC936_10620 [Leptolyngbyaceae cyanobacterium SU_3_3]|nr:hypothetical protein [Leptolyngbyaceae cyanobacterium SU_3_3]